MDHKKPGQDNFVMEEGAKVPCDDFRQDQPADQQCGFDKGVCPFDGDESKCGERN